MWNILYNRVLSWRDSNFSVNYMVNRIVNTASVTEQEAYEFVMSVLND